MLLPFYILFVEGITPVILKLYLTLIPYNLILILSQFLGLIFISFYVLFFKSNEIFEGYKSLNFRLLIVLVLIAFFSSFLSKVFFLKTLNDNDNISILLIIMSLYPIITIIGSYFLLKERLTYLQILGYFFIIIGICFLLYKPS